MILTFSRTMDAVTSGGSEEEDSAGEVTGEGAGLVDSDPSAGACVSTGNEVVGEAVVAGGGVPTISARIF